MISCPQCGAFGRPFGACPSCGSAVTAVPRSAVALLLGLSVGCVGETKTSDSGHSGEPVHSSITEPDYGVALHTGSAQADYGAALHSGDDGHTGTTSN